VYIKSKPRKKLLSSPDFNLYISILWT